MTGAAGGGLAGLVWVPVTGALSPDFRAEDAVEGGEETGGVAGGDWAAAIVLSASTTAATARIAG